MYKKESETLLKFLTSPNMMSSLQHEEEGGT